jgi:alpha-beta hydrolase superfamily lysophospholipase
MQTKIPSLAIAATLAVAAGTANAAAMSDAQKAQVHYRFEQVGKVKVFYREAGDPASRTILLLHGFAASSFMYRDLIPALSDRYHVVAPDLPSFGSLKHRHAEPSSTPSTTSPGQLIALRSSSNSTGMR